MSALDHMKHAHQLALFGLYEAVSNAAMQQKLTQYEEYEKMMCDSTSGVDRCDHA